MLLTSLTRFVYLKKNVLAPGDITNFLSYYYNLDSSSISNTLIKNIVTSTYDASLINLTTLDTTNPKLGTACLALTNASSQYMKINNISINANGSSIAYWVKTNNTTDSSNCFCVFDFNNGIGNSTIKHLIYNNSLNSYVMNNSYKNATISFSNYIDLSLSSVTLIDRVAVSNNNIMIYAGNYNNGTTTANGTYYRTFNGTIWSTPVLLHATKFNNISITPDGSTVVACNQQQAINNIYYFKRTGTTYTSGTIITDISGVYNFYGIDISADSKMIVVANIDGYIYFSTWDGTKYTALTATNETRRNQWIGVKISSDKQKIVYATAAGGLLCYATWNGTNFSSGIQVGTTSYTYRNVGISLDGNIIFGSLSSNATASLVYSCYDSSSNTYSELSTVPTTAIPANLDLYGFCVTSNNTIYGAIGNHLYSTKMNISSQSLCPDVFNIPQNTYNHIVQTTSNAGTYKFYLNNTLIKSFNSQIIYSNILTTTNNIGFSPGLKNSYFDGRIDDFRVYNKELTVNDVNTLYNYKYTLTDSMMVYLKFDQGDFSGNTIANWATGIAVYTNINFSGVISAKLNTTVNKVGSGCMDVSDLSGNTVTRYTYDFSGNTGPYSIAVWFKTNSSLNGTIFDLGGTTYIRFISTSLQVGTESTPGVTRVVYGSPFTGAYQNNAWHHVVYVMPSTGSSSVYINGTLIQTINNAFPITNYFGGQNITIGNNTYNGSPFFGYIDDVRVYTRVLTAAEVTTIYTNTY